MPFCRSASRFGLDCSHLLHVKNKFSGFVGLPEVFLDYIYNYAMALAAVFLGFFTGILGPADLGAPMQADSVQASGPTRQSPDVATALKVQVQAVTLPMHAPETRSKSSCKSAIQACLFAEPEGQCSSTPDRQDRWD